MSVTSRTSAHTGDVLTVANAWYQARHNRTVRWVSRSEYALARRLIEAHGLEQVVEIMPVAVEIVKKRWPGGVTLMSVDSYWDQAVALFKQGSRPQPVEARPVPPPTPAPDPAARIVLSFYRQWFGGSYLADPTAKELEQAHKLIEQFQDRTEAVVEQVIAVLRRKWPDARTFSAVLRYLPAVASPNQSDERRRTDEKIRAMQEEQRRREEESRREGEAFRAKWTPVWNALSADERAEISQVIIERFPHLKGKEPLLQDLRLKEMVRRRPRN